ncbi:unnamed protein product [Amoebophrya sp. A25]|nr:unnamed protein product [Amoebophrya sp. A25]|eukprot:GSA25T00009704001.1
MPSSKTHIRRTSTSGTPDHKGDAFSPQFGHETAAFVHSGSAKLPVPVSAPLQPEAPVVGTQPMIPSLELPQRPSLDLLDEVGRGSSSASHIGTPRTITTLTPRTTVAAEEEHICDQFAALARKGEDRGDVEDEGSHVHPLVVQQSEDQQHVLDEPMLSGSFVTAHSYVTASEAPGPTPDCYETPVRGTRRHSDDKPEGDNIHGDRVETGEHHQQHCGPQMEVQIKGAEEGIALATDVMMKFSPTLEDKSVFSNAREAENGHGDNVDATHYHVEQNTPTHYHAEQNSAKKGASFAAHSFAAIAGTEDGNTTRALQLPDPSEVDPDRTISWLSDTVATLRTITSQRKQMQGTNTTCKSGRTPEKIVEENLEEDVEVVASRLLEDPVKVDYASHCHGVLVVEGEHSSGAPGEQHAHDAEMLLRSDELPKNQVDVDLMQQVEDQPVPGRPVGVEDQPGLPLESAGPPGRPGVVPGGPALSASQENKSGSCQDTLILPLPSPSAAVGLAAKKMKYHRPGRTSRYADHGGGGDGDVAGLNGDFNIESPNIASNQQHLEVVGVATPILGEEQGMEAGKGNVEVHQAAKNENMFYSEVEDAKNKKQEQQAPAAVVDVNHLHARIQQVVRKSHQQSQQAKQPVLGESARRLKQVVGDSRNRKRGSVHGDAVSASRNIRKAPLADALQHPNRNINRTPPPHAAAPAKQVKSSVRGRGGASPNKHKSNVFNMIRGNVDQRGGNMRQGPGGGNRDKHFAACSPSPIKRAPNNHKVDQKKKIMRALSPYLVASPYRVPLTPSAGRAESKGKPRGNSRTPSRGVQQSEHQGENRSHQIKQDHEKGAPSRSPDKKKTEQQVPQRHHNHHQPRAGPLDVLKHHKERYMKDNKIGLNKRTPSVSPVRRGARPPRGPPQSPFVTPSAAQRNSNKPTKTRASQRQRSPSFSPSPMVRAMMKDRRVAPLGPVSNGVKKFAEAQELKPPRREQQLVVSDKSEVAPEAKDVESQTKGEVVTTHLAKQADEEQNLNNAREGVGQEDVQLLSPEEKFLFDNPQNSFDVDVDNNHKNSTREQEQAKAIVYNDISSALDQAVVLSGGGGTGSANASIENVNDRMFSGAMRSSSGQQSEEPEPECGCAGGSSGGGAAVLVTTGTGVIPSSGGLGSSSPPAVMGGVEHEHQHSQSAIDDTRNENNNSPQPKRRNSALSTREHQKNSSSSTKNFKSSYGHHVSSSLDISTTIREEFSKLFQPTEVETQFAAQIEQGTSMLHYSIDSGPSAFNKSAPLQDNCTPQFANNSNRLRLPAVNIRESVYNLLRSTPLRKTRTLPAQAQSLLSNVLPTTNKCEEDHHHLEDGDIQMNGEEFPLSLSSRGKNPARNSTTIEVPKSDFVMLDVRQPGGARTEPATHLSLLRRRILPKTAQPLPLGKRRTPPKDLVIDIPSPPREMMLATDVIRSSGVAKTEDVLVRDPLVLEVDHATSATTTHENVNDDASFQPAPVQEVPEFTATTVLPSLERQSPENVKQKTTTSTRPIKTVVQDLNNNEAIKQARSAIRPLTQEHQEHLSPPQGSKNASFWRNSPAFGTPGARSRLVGSAVSSSGKKSHSSTEEEDCCNLEESLLAGTPGPPMLTRETPNLLLADEDDEVAISPSPPLQKRFLRSTDIATKQRRKSATLPLNHGSSSSKANYYYNSTGASTSTARTSSKAKMLISQSQDRLLLPPLSQSAMKTRKSATMGATPARVQALWAPPVPLVC